MYSSWDISPWDLGQIENIVLYIKSWQTIVEKGHPY